MEETSEGFTYQNVHHATCDPPWEVRPGVLTLELPLPCRSSGPDRRKKSPGSSPCEKKRSTRSSLRVDQDQDQDQAREHAFRPIANNARNAYLWRRVCEDKGAHGRSIWGVHPIAISVKRKFRFSSESNSKSVKRSYFYEKLHAFFPLPSLADFLLGLTSCHMSNSSPMPETNNHGKPHACGMGNVQTVHAKIRM